MSNSQCHSRKRRDQAAALGFWSAAGSEAPRRFLFRSRVGRWSILPALLLVQAAAFAGDFQLAQSITALGGGASTGGPYVLTDTFGQHCIGEADSIHHHLESGFWSTIGSPPLPGSITLTAQPTQTLTLSIEDLVSGVSDPDGDQVHLQAADPLSFAGGTVTLGTNAILYTAPLDFAGYDWFNYFVVDDGGDVAIGAVMVLVDSSGGHSPPIVFGPAIVDRFFVVRFAGAPGFTYTIEYTDGLTPANWRKHSNIIAPAEAGSSGPGVFEVRQAITEQPSRFFRIKYPAY